jgi:two-component system response regulator ChvI
MTTALEQPVVALAGGALAQLASVGEADLCILVIEEGATDRGVLTDELSSQGFDVRTIASLDGAPDAVRAADVIVLHCDRAKTSGFDMLSKLHGLGFNVPVVLLTDKPLPAHECLALDKGAVDVVCRSRGPAVLARRIKGAVKVADRTGQLRPDVGRAYWKDADLDLTLGEYKIVHLLASSIGTFVTYRAVYDRLRHEGFIAGEGANGYRANVRSAIKRIRNKFRDFDPTFDKIENYPGFGYCWKKSD